MLLVHAFSKRSVVSAMQGLISVWCGRQGNRYIPSIVRVGLSVHHSVEAVSLDALVEQRLRSAAKAKLLHPLPPMPQSRSILLSSVTRCSKSPCFDAPALLLAVFTDV